MAPRVTLENLAVMVKAGFEDVAKEVADFRADMSQFRAETEAHFDRIDIRLD